MDKPIIHKLVLFIAAVCSTVSVSAYDFEVDGIYYDKISDTSVEVTHDGSFNNNNGAGYSGVVIIPETIEINGITYSVRGIGVRAFSNCTGLTSVTISEGVASIGDFAFADCTDLTSVTIPEGATSIGAFAFRSCTGLTSVTVPASVTSFGDFVFLGCTGLTEIIINENNPKYASIDGVWFNKTYSELILCPAGKAGIYNIPQGVTSICRSAFSGCTGLTSVNIPEGVASIGDGAFSHCIGLTSVTIPASVTSIGNEAFRRCSGLISATIPASVTSIGYFAFRGCLALNKVIFFAETVPTFGYSVFTEVPTTCSIYVPSGTRGSYASADELASYTIKEFGLTVTPAEVKLEVGATAELTASYTVDGTLENEKEISSVLGTEFTWSSSAEKCGYRKHHRANNSPERRNSRD